MTWRTVLVETRAKLDLRLNFLCVRSAEGVKQIHLGEIGLLMIASTAVSVSVALLAELTKRKIKVIFCDEKHLPSSELLPSYGHHRSSERIREQIAWTTEIKARVWQDLVKNKILSQAKLLEKGGYLREAEMLIDYAAQVELKDRSNREGHAAKVYFNRLFGPTFTRKSEGAINAALNYGYSVLLALISREIVSNGYLTQLGVFHDSVLNPFNLSSDFIEPVRFLVDTEIVKQLKLGNFQAFGGEERRQMLKILNQQVLIGGRKHTVMNAVKDYVRSALEALTEENVQRLSYLRYED